MKRVIRGTLGALALTMSFSAPLLADDLMVEKCQARVIKECADTLEDSNWFEKIAVGVACVGRLASCSAISITVNAF